MYSQVFNFIELSWGIYIVLSVARCRSSINSICMFFNLWTLATVLVSILFSSNYYYFDQTICYCVLWRIRKIFIIFGRIFFVVETFELRYYRIHRANDKLLFGVVAWKCEKQRKFSLNSLLSNKLSDLIDSESVNMYGVCEHIP